ncbi:unnamed protein product, partial [Pylaiella littoralis]
GIHSVVAWGVGSLAVLAATTTATATNNTAAPPRLTRAAAAAAASLCRPTHKRESRERLNLCLSQAKRKILSEGLVSNAATLLEFSPGAGNGASPASLMLSAMGAARSSSKRKRSGVTVARRDSPGKGKEGASTPTVVICDEASFSSARASEDMAGIFSKYPLKDDASSVEVVKSHWLSECLRLGSCQPTRPYLLDTITLATVGNFLERNTAAAVAAAAAAAMARATGGSAATAPGGAPTAKSSSSSSWGCLARPASAKARAKSSAKSPSAGKHQAPQGGGSSSSSSTGGGGSRGSDGPGTLSKEPVWRDSDSGGGGGGGGRWEELMGGSVLRWVPNTTRVSTHIAAFDMDGTLIKTKSGKRFGDAKDDWRLWHGSIPVVLRKWYDRGYKVAIISNQMGVGTGKVDQKMLQAKVRLVVEALGVPVEAYLACHDDYYRKPRLGCWDLLSTSHNGGLDVEKEACLYVGDAAGRPKQGTYKKDFSAGDLKLALNAGIPFQTPEQFFMRSTQPLHTNRSLAVLGFDPYTLVGDTPKASEALSRDGSGLEVVVLVGPPGGGKSTLCTDRLPRHARVNQDEMKTLEKCKRAAQDFLKDGTSVVIDATNPGRNTRATWVALAKQHGATPRCIFLTTSKEACFHLNAFRGCNPWSPKEGRRKVPDVVIHTWFKYVDPPQTNEAICFDARPCKQGFSEVISLPFAMRDFGEQRDGQAEREFLLMHIIPK